MVIGRSHDQDCEDPLTSCDGEGAIQWHPQHRRYGSSESTYYAALGLTTEGDPDFSSDAVQAVMRQKGFELLQKDRSLMAKLRQHRRSYGKPETHASIFADLTVLFETYSIEECNEYDIARALFGYHSRELENVVEPIVELFADEDFQQKAWQEARPGDVDAVLLDCYEHSGIALSIHGAGMQCQFDTSRGAAVWVPDACARDEITRRGVVYAFGKIVDFRLRGPNKLRFHASFTQTGESASFAEWHEAFSWLESKAALPVINTIQVACVSQDPAQSRGFILECNGTTFISHNEAYAYRATLVAERVGDAKLLAQGRYRAAVELAQGAVELYNSWSNGDCWGIVTEVFSEQGDLLESDHYWGLVGYEYADQEVADRLAYYQKEYPQCVSA